MPKLKVSLEEFDSALESLNLKLKNRNLSISIKAIGGYAMLKYGLRVTKHENANENTGYSEDIDSVSEKYTDEIIELILEVSKEKDLFPDWLNNDSFYMLEVSIHLDFIY